MCEVVAGAEVEPKSSGLTPAPQFYALESSLSRDSSSRSTSPHCRPRGQRRDVVLGSVRVTIRMALALPGRLRHDKQERLRGTRVFVVGVSLLIINVRPVYQLFTSTNSKASVGEWL